MPELSIVSDGKDIFIKMDGRAIAKRGHPNTKHARTWIPLQPGYAVYSNKDHSQITVQFNGNPIAIN